MKKLLSLLLCILLLFCVIPTASVSAASDTVYVLAGSDFQVNSFATGMAQINTFVRRMYYNGVSKFDGLLFCGDYTMHLNNKVEDSVEGYEKLMEVLDPVVGDHRVFVQGNHDPAGCRFLSKTGNNDAKHYGVFVLNEDAYPSYNNSGDSEAHVKKLANQLKDYLDEKISQGYNKPVFIASHVPLHYSMRTLSGSDGKFANYIFDVLNEAGKKLNIFFLFGHDHNNGYDDYLGGAAIYLKKGDSINIAQASLTDFDVETLNFTYMNAGYTGYYNNHNNAYDTLTMTLFEINGNNVTVSRYSNRGLVDLKAKGVRNEYKNETGYDPDLTVYASPRLVTLGGDVQAAKPTTTQKAQTTTQAATTTVTTTKATTKATTKPAPGLFATTGTDAVTTQAITTTLSGNNDQPTIVTTVTVADGVTTNLTDTTTTVLADGDGATDTTDTTTAVDEATITTTEPTQPSSAQPSSPALPIVIGVAVLVAAGVTVIVVLELKKKQAA